MNDLVKPPKAAVFGAANGVMFMTFFGALWASIGIIGSNPLGAPWFLVISGIVTIVLLVAAISLFGKSKNMSSNVTPNVREDWKTINRKFGLIFGLEGLAICIASIICNLIDRFELFFPIMAIMVGIHFFPLARLFKEKFYWGTGAALCILGIISFFLPIEAAYNSASIVPRSIFIGFGSAITLWITGFRIWTMTSKQLK